MRWVGQIVMPLFVGIVAASCTGNSTVSAPRPDDLADASVEITLQSSGDARMMLTLARFDPINTPALAERVARIAFPSAGAVTIDDDRSYSDSVALRIESATEPGEPSIFRFPGDPLMEEFRQGGYATGDLTVCWPNVPTELRAEAPATAIDHCLRWWGVDVGDRIPAIEVVMHPEPWRWAAGMTAVALSVLAGIAALVFARSWRSRRASFPAGVVVASIVAMLSGAAALVAGGAAGTMTHLQLSGRAGDASAAAIIVTAVLSTIAVGLVALDMGVTIHTVGAWSARRRVDRSVPSRTDVQAPAGTGSITR